MLEDPPPPPIEVFYRKIGKKLFLEMADKYWVKIVAYFVTDILLFSLDVCYSPSTLFFFGLFDAHSLHFSKFWFSIVWRGVSLPLLKLFMAIVCLRRLYEHGVVGDEGCIGPSKKLLWYVKPPKNYVTHAWHNSKVV